MELEDPHPLATVSEQPPTLSGLGNRRGVSPSRVIGSGGLAPGLEVLECFGMT
jgi:hypothetical protein